MAEQPSTSDSQTLSLTRRGMRGAVWNYSGAGVVMVSQLFYTALTARLISPSDFGAYATAQAMLALVGYFTLRAVGAAIVRAPELDRRAIGSAILLTGGAAAVVTVVVVLTAGIWADAWRSPRAASLIRLFAPYLVLYGLATVPMGLLQRAMRYRTASLVETSAVVIGFGVGAILAVRLRSADALVLGQITTGGALLALAVAATRRELSLMPSWERLRAFFSFSAQVSVQNLNHYVNNTLPSFAVSRFLGQTSLGYFSRALVLVSLPRSFLADGVYKTLYPIYPRFRKDSGQCRRMMNDVANVTMTMVWPLFAALAGLAPLVVDLLLGATWEPVATITLPLCVLAAVNFAYTNFAWFAESFGYLRQMWIVQIVWTAVLIGGLVVAVQGDAGMRTIALVACGTQIVAHLLQVVLLARTRFIDGVGVLKAELAATLVSFVWYAATALTTNALSESTMGARLAGACLVVGLLTLATWIALPFLPAGRAFARRGIRVSWRPRAVS